ncbi:MAG: hypothetical protein L0H93_07180 [Nocardioides sp.]|nr:hypothetical protein [Nocardioides sp.]
MSQESPLTGEVDRSKKPPWWLFALSGIGTQFLLMVNGVIAARMLGVDGRGQVVMVAILAAMASQLTLGGSLPNAITRQLADRGVTARDGLHGMLARWTLWGLLAAAVAGGYLAWLERDGSRTTAWLLALLTVVSALQAMASRILMGAMLGEGTNLTHVALTGVLPQVVVVVVVGGAFAVGIRWNAVELLTVTVVSTGLVLLARLKVLAAPTRRPEDRLDRIELARLARRTHIGSVGPIDGLAIDRVLVGSLLGSYALGLYSAAFALGGLTSIFGACLAMVALPQITKAQKELATEPAAVRSWLVLSVLLIGAVVLVLEVGTGLIIRLTFGEPFLPATEVSRWLIAASGLLGLRRVLISVLQARDRGGLPSLVELALTPVVVLGILVAAHQDSLVAVGVTMTVVGALACGVLGVAVARSRPA